MASYFRNLLAMVRKPYYSAVPIFSPGQDLSWIPSVGGFTVQPLGGATDGANTIFTASSSSPMIVRNGLVQTVTNDYTITLSGAGSVITFVVPPAVDDSLEEVNVAYQPERGTFAVLSPLLPPDGVRRTFTFTAPPKLVYFNTLIFIPGVSIQASGNTVTFGSALDPADVLRGLY